MTHQDIQKHIIEIIEKLGFDTGSVSVTHDERSNTLWFSIDSKDARILLGRGAEALSALNHIVLKTAEKLCRDVENAPRVMVDADGFEKKKIENLKTIAHMMAERARYFKSSIDVDPMSARDRRIIHEFLADIPDVTTESKGEGKKRHVVITYRSSEI